MRKQSSSTSGFQSLLGRLPLPVAQLLRRAAVTRNALESHNLAYFAAEAMLKLAAAGRIGIYLEHALDPGSPLAGRLEQLLLPSTGHWLAFLRELSAELAQKQPPIGLPLVDLHRELIRRQVDWEATPAFYKAVASHEVLPPQLLTDARRRGVMGFLTVLVAYRNAVVAHGSGRLPAFYEEMAPLLFKAVCEVLENQALLGGLDLAVARLSIEEGGASAGISWQVLLGLAGLPLSVLQSQSGAKAEDESVTPSQVYLVGPGVRVPLHPLVVFSEDESGQEHIGILNRAEEGASTPDAATVKRAEFLDYSVGKAIVEMDATGELAALLGKLRGLGSKASALQETVSGLQRELDSHGSWLLEPGTILGDFEIEHELGRGGMGVVYKGRQLSLDRPVAIKVMRSGLGDASARQRFQREARSMAKIDQSNVVAVYGFGEAEGYPFIAMRYVEGETLAERIERAGTLPPAEALQITRGVVEGLNEAWERGVIHRDLKPSNILLDHKGRPLVADFGLAKPVEMDEGADLTGDQGLLGTPHYMAPEQARGEAVDHRSDMYALGVMLYEMLTGQRPFSGKTPYEIVGRKLNEPVPEAMVSLPDLPPAVDDLIQSLTARDPQDRPGDYSRILSRLDQLASGDAPTSKVRVPRWGRVGAIFRKTRRGLTLGVVFLVVLSFWWGGQQRPEKTGDQPNAKIDTMAVAIAPFFGPDEESARQGKVIATLIERELKDQAKRDWVKVIGPRAVGEPITSHDQAREVGTRLGVRLVVWGESLAFGQQTELQPHLTVLDAVKEAETQKQTSSQAGPLGVSEDMPGAENPGNTVIPMGGANEIELAKTSASQVSRLVQTVAINFLLATDDHAEEALRHIEALPETAQTLLLKGRALLQLHRDEEALNALKDAAEMDPSRPEPLALMADLCLKAKKWSLAAETLKKANATGKPYRTKNGLWVGNTLLMAEDFHSVDPIYPDTKPDKIYRTLYVLERDPQNGIVHKRLYLPAVPEAFEFSGDGVFLLCRKTSHGPLTWKVPWKNHQVGLSVYPPPSLLPRLKGIQCPQRIAYNFTGDIMQAAALMGKISKPSFHLREKPRTELPTTLPELIDSLRDAIRQDPTQPWYHFWLGQALWAREERPQAEREWLITLQPTSFQLPYYEYLSMATAFESLGQDRWSDDAYYMAGGRAQKWLAPESSPSFLERLFAFQVERLAQNNPQLISFERRAQWRERRIGLLGLNKYDLFSIAAWKDYWREKGDARELSRESRRFQTVIKDPLTSWSPLVMLDCWQNIVVAFGLATIFILVLLRRRSVKNLQAGAAQQKWSLRSRGMDLLFLLVLCSAYIFLFFVLLPEKGPSPILGQIFLCFLAVLVLCRMSSRGRSFDPSKERKHRLPRSLMIGQILLLVTLLLVFNLLIAREFMFLDLPFGMLDGIGHPGILEKLDQADLSPSHAYTFIKAVSFQRAGNFKQAYKLYEQLGKDPRARRNLEAFDRKQIQAPELPRSADVQDALQHRSTKWWIEMLLKPSSKTLFRAFGSGYEKQFFLIFQLLGSGILFALLMLFETMGRGKRGSQQAAGPALGHSRASPKRIDSMPWLKSWLRYASLLLILVSVFRVYPSIRYQSPAMGNWTRDLVYNYLNMLVFPMENPPLDPDARQEYLITTFFWTSFWAQPYAKLYWSILAILALMHFGFFIRWLIRWKWGRARQAQVED